MSMSRKVRVLCYRSGLSLAVMYSRKRLCRTRAMRRIKRVRLSKTNGVLSINRVLSVSKSLYYVSNIK